MSIRATSRFRSPLSILPHSPNSRSTRPPWPRATGEQGSAASTQDHPPQSDPCRLIRQVNEVPQLAHVLQHTSGPLPPRAAGAKGSPASPKHPGRAHRQLEGFVLRTPHVIRIMTAQTGSATTAVHPAAAMIDSEITFHESGKRPPPGLPGGSLDWRLQRERPRHENSTNCEDSLRNAAHAPSGPAGIFAAAADGPERARPSAVLK